MSNEETGEELKLKCGCKGRIIGIEYAYGSPERYDGVSEWKCQECGRRWGRWSKTELFGQEIEPRYGVEQKRRQDLAKVAKDLKPALDYLKDK